MPDSNVGTEVLDLKFSGYSLIMLENMNRTDPPVDRIHCEILNSCNKLVLDSAKTF